MGIFDRAKDPSERAPRPDHDTDRYVEPGGEPAGTATAPEEDPTASDPGSADGSAAPNTAGGLPSADRAS